MNTKNMGIAALAALAITTVAQDAPSTTPAPSSSASSVGQTSNANQYRAGISSAGGGGVGFGGSGSYGQRLNSIVARAGGAPSSPALYFEPGSEKQAAEMAEDLQVLEYLIGRNLERALGEQATEYRLGVPILLRGDGRAVQASYVQGYGVLVKINVPFALTGSGDDEPKKKDPNAPASDWEKARRALHGGESGHTDEPSAAYDPKIIATVKKQIFESLKSVTNLRHVKDDEWVSVAVVGGSSAPRAVTGGGFGGSGFGSNAYGGAGVMSSTAEGGAPPSRTSILAVRIKKSSASGSAEDVARVAQVNAYFEAPGPAPTESRRVQRSSTPVGR